MALLTFFRALMLQRKLLPPPRFSANLLLFIIFLSFSSNLQAQTDTTPPTVSSIAFTSTGPYKQGDVITLQVTFSEKVTVGHIIHGTPRIHIQIGNSTQTLKAVASTTAKTTHNFNYTVVAADSDSDGVSIATTARISTFDASLGIVITDEAGNDMTVLGSALPDTLATNQSGHKVDTTAPTVSSMALTSTGPYGVGDVITVTVTFSEKVKISNTSILEVVVGANRRSAQITTPTSTTFKTTHDFSYTVVAGDSDSNGIAIIISVITLADKASESIITDETGNTAVARIPALGNQSGHEVDTTAPTIATFDIDTSNTGPYGIGEVITLAVLFSEVVTIDTGSAPSIPLTIGTNTRAATAAATTTAAQGHNFTYTVVSADADSDGIQVLTAATLSNHGKIKDAAGNALSSNALPNNLNSNPGSYIVDTTVPTLSSIAITSTGLYGIGDVITLQATFSESVTISTGTAASIPLTIGSTTRNATATATNTASTTHNFTYTVAGTDSDTNGLSVASSAVLANPGRIKDTAGNAMTATALPDTLNSNQSSHKVDGVLPTISSITLTSTGPYKSGDVITLQATFSESVTIATGTAASIPLTIGSNSRNATAATNNTASTTQNFTYTVASTDSDTDGISVANRRHSFNQPWPHKRHRR